MAESMKWPDTSAHGFVLNLLRAEHTTVALIRSAGRLDAATRDALANLGFEHTSAFDAETGGQLRRPVAGLAVAALVKAFPSTVIRPHDPASVFVTFDALSPHTEAQGQEAFEHHGKRIYPCKVRDSDTGSVAVRWAIETADNRARRLAGERTIGGDRLADTIESAKAIAEEESARDMRDAADALARAAADQSARNAAEARRREVDGMSLSEIKANDYLKSLVRDRDTGEVMTRHAWVARKVAQGLTPTTTTTDKVKPMSRTQFNRATQAQQQAHERRVAAGGKVTEYWLGEYAVKKTEYDLAVRLALAASPATEAQPTAERAVAEADDRSAVDTPAEQVAVVGAKRVVSMFVERERHHQRPGSYSLSAILDQSPDGADLVLGNVQPQWLPLLVGHEFAQRIIREADQYPDGHRYEPIDIQILPNGFPMPEDPVAAMARTIETMGGASRVMSAASGEVFDAIRARGLERVWTILQDAHGNEIVWPGYLGSMLTGATGYALSTQAWTPDTAPMLFTASPSTLAQAQARPTDAREAEAGRSAPAGAPSRSIREVAELVREHGGDGPEGHGFPERVRALDALARAIERYDADAIVDHIGWDTRSSDYLRSVFRWASGMEDLPSVDMAAKQPELRAQVSQWVSSQEDFRAYVLHAPSDPECDGGFWAESDGGRWVTLLSEATRYAKSQWQSMPMPHPKATALLEPDAEMLAATMAVASRDPVALSEAMDAFVDRFGEKSPDDGMFDSAEEAAEAGASSRTWSIVEGGDGDLWAVAGVRRVNTIGYIVTEHPWTSDDDTYLYAPENVDDLDGGPRDDDALDDDVVDEAPDGPGATPRMQGDAAASSAALSSRDIDGDDAELVAEFESWMDKAASDDAAASPAPRRARRSGKRIEDFGEKIGGARKDLALSRARGWMVADDIASWTEFELQTMVNKDSVWPAPDYRAMVDSGVPREVVFWIKQIRDKIYTSPDYSRGQAWPDAARRYVETVGGLAERLASVRSTEDAVSVARHYASVTIEQQRRLGWQRVADGGGEFVDVKKYQLTDAGQDVQSMMGRETVRAGRRRRKEDYTAMPYLMRSALDPFNAAPTPFADERERLAGRKWAEWPEAATKRATTTQRDAHKDRDQVRPHLAHLLRVAPTGRDGRDIDEREFMTTFGFRAGEFGNWLTAKDRQQVFNHAYDALSDLATALDVPKDALSLGGSLAIAFGARGRGGKRSAAAHYEPGRHVINLTKIHGDGSLAHEWAHAFDAWLYGQVRTHLRGGAKSMPFITEEWASRTSSTKMDGRPDRSNGLLGASRDIGKVESEAIRHVVGAFDDVMRVMRTRTCSPEESMTALREQRDQRAEYLNSWIGWLRSNYLDALCIPKDQRGGDSVHREVIAFDAAHQRYMNAQHFKDADEACRELIHASVHEARRYATVRCRSPMIAKNMKNGVLVLEGERHELPTRNSEIALAERDLAAFASAVTPMVVWTAYAKDAKRRDEDRSSPYFTQPCELFARAFESIVFDRLADAGIRSDYLVHGVEDGAMRSEKYGSPYPCGEDRVAVRKAMDALIAALPVTEMVVAREDLTQRSAPRGPSL